MGQKISSLHGFCRKLKHLGRIKRKRLANTGEKYLAWTQPEAQKHDSRTGGGGLALLYPEIQHAIDHAKSVHEEKVNGWQTASEAGE